MFSVIQSPCVFEPLTMVNPFEEDRFGFGPELKRRRGIVKGCRDSKNVPKSSSLSMRYTVEETLDSYVLSLYRKLPEGRIAKEVNKELTALKDAAYRPVYHIVHDMFGNPYYLEEEQDEDEILRKVFPQLDMRAITRKVARELFQDLSIELNHRGDELQISSQIDGISKSFMIGEQIADVRVSGCKIDESNEYGILRLVLEKIPDTSNLVNLIKWSELSSSEKADKQRKIEEAEAKATAASKFEMQKKEDRLRVEAEAAKRLAERREAERAEAETKAAEIERQKEEEQRLNAEAKVAQRQKETQLEIARHKSNLGNSKKKSKLQKKAAKEKKIKEMKAALVAEKRANRLQKQSEKSSTSPNNITINITFKDDKKKGFVRENSTSLKRLPSPVLEDVEDEEIDRFNASLVSSTSGSPIIEDAL